MNISWIDWGIIGFFYFGLLGVGLYSRKYMRGVADFLVAGRGMRKYLGYSAGGAADVGAISVCATMESFYVGGPAMLFYGITGLFVGLFVGLTGFTVVRLRETKIMTLPQLFEMRYSKGVRVLAGVVCAFAGILNMGIFPIVAGRFFTHFGGLPAEFALFGLVLPTIPVLTAVLIGAAISFAFLGGQVSVIVTDFIQSVAMSSMFVAVGYCVYRAVSWSSISTAVSASDNVEVLLNPFTSGGSFGLKYLILGLVGLPFSVAAWPTGMNKIMAANSPKGARLMMLFKNMRLLSWASIAYVGFATLAVMNLSEFSHLGLAESVDKLDPSIQNQMAGPILLGRVLPVGIMGLMFAGMMSAFISTNDSYMLTWASVIVQDVIYPLRKKPLPQKQHLWLLRITVLVVGIIIYTFGILYKPNETILEFQILSGAIYTAGAGTIITFALYWRRGTKYGAYCALIVGAIIPILNRIFDFVGGFEGGIVTYLAAPTAFVVVSLISKNPHFDLEKMLNRPSKIRKK